MQIIMKIELLSPTLLNNSILVQDFKDLSLTLGKNLGWHYLLDLVWCVEQLNVQLGDKVLDAGAGWGLMQFWLAGQGVDLVSVDRMVRKKIPPEMDRHYGIEGYRKRELMPALKDFLPPRSPRFWSNYPMKFKTTLGMLGRALGIAPRYSETHKKPGKIMIYNQELRDLKAIKDNSMDWIVSISSLEHNSPEDLTLCLKELKRIIKPGGKLVATLCASKVRDWFHEPSQGWCYTEATLLKYFNTPKGEYSSNYLEFDEIFEAIFKCSELSSNLASFYFKSGENGMPWGIWDPKYIPVGLVKDF